jgi:hypothetical protein
MTRIYVAAGALLLGTSGLALAADTGKTPLAVKAMVVGAQSAKMASDWTKADTSTFAKSASAIDKSSTFEKASWDKPAEGGAKLALASSSDFSAKSHGMKPLADDGTELAALDADLKPLAMAEADMAAVDKPEAMTGMGGPLEDADLTPRVATENYPPCSPGPGDDRCIQLYEPGVRAQLASWNRPTGGLADNSVTTAMGGPFEPVEVDGMETEVATTEEKTVLASADSDATSHVVHDGVGGPVEAQSGYPPCSPGAGDDRCIQLYEPGVTGAGN